MLNPNALNGDLEGPEALEHPRAYGKEGEQEELVISDDDLLAIVRSERLQSLGIDFGDDVTAQRRLGMNYYKGEMDDVPALPGRSSVVSTDVADAIRSAIPDLMDIFIGGEEIGSFCAVGPEDEQAAKQETQIVNHVIMAQNDGFGLVFDGIHDALLNKVGVYNFWVEEDEKYAEETLEHVDFLALQDLEQSQETEVLEKEIAGIDDLTGEPFFRVEVRKSERKVCVKIKAVAPENFAVARDTVNLRDATYCYMRTTPRVQDLKAKGFDKDLVDALPTYSIMAHQQTDLARDTAGEHNIPYAGATNSGDLRMVVVHVHVVRIDADGDGTPEVWRIDTDERDTIILQKQRLNCVPFAGGSPYRQPHRFYGQSLADLLIDAQRIKTALTRAALDARYFSLNQRYEVADSGSNEHTISDLLNNTPGYPVRVKQAGTVNAIGSAGFDLKDFEALEYFSTVIEQKSGVVRNAQGLNPDTLHDTARGMEAMVSAAQKRIRLIARTLAETMFRDLFVGVHSLLRTYGSKPMTARIRNEWVTVDPTTWGVREDMTIEIGMGGGREHDLVVMNMLGERMNQIVEGQASGAIPTPIVTPTNIFNFMQDFAERAGSKGGSKYFTDPREAEAMQAQQPPPPDPEMVKIEQQTKLEQAKQQSQQQLAAIKYQQDQELARAKAEQDAMLAEAQARQDAQLQEKKIEAETRLAAMRMANEKALAEAQMQQEWELAQMQMAQEKELAVFQARLNAEVGIHKNEKSAEVQMQKNRPGGALNK